jgi:hypothetical protein
VFQQFGEYTGMCFYVNIKTDHMNPNDKNNNKQNEQTPASDNNVIKAHTEADKDIAKDPDFSIHSKNDDLDEGELARLGGDKSDLA